MAGLARGALPELVDDRHARLVAGGSTDAVVASLADALLQAVELDRDACREHAVRTCSVETMVDRYERLYADPAAQLAGRAA